jgi:hypothetical protein
MSLTFHQRSTIQRAIDVERRRIVRPETTCSNYVGAGKSLSDWCLTEAHGDSLIALDLAVDAHAKVLERRRAGYKSYRL